jgi:hypothetical protein
MRSALVVMVAVAPAFTTGIARAQGAPGAPSQSSAPCIAIVLPSVDGVDDSMTVANGVQSLFQSYLTGPTLRSIALQAKLPSQATQEAIQKQCTKVLSVSMSRKSGGGGNRKLGALSQAAGTAAGGYIPASGAAEVAVAGAAAGAEAVGSLAYGTRAKDEMRIEYRLTTVDGDMVLGPRTDSLKVKSNGEDIVTPLVAKAADAVAAAAARQ